MKNYVIVSNKPWHDILFSRLSSSRDENWMRIKEKDEFNFNNLLEYKPLYIFIPHWSFIIPKNIYENFNCILFHMTDLPFGRGGSPLQNLVIRGFQETVVSAIKVSETIDSGDVYLKKKISLLGTAEEIFLRSSGVIEEMIKEIISKNLTPQKQSGEVVEFKRRRPSDSDISSISSIEYLFDFIRMLDCVDYPKAFIETDFLKFEFSRASLKSDNSIIADVRITKK